MTSRRSFLGLMASALAMPAIGAIVPADPTRKRGGMTTYFHIDESARPTIFGDMWLNTGDGKVYLRNATDEWEIVKGPTRLELPVNTSMYQQNYAIPLEQPKSTVDPSLLFWRGDGSYGIPMDPRRFDINGIELP
jgi:hypothetical protein